MRVYERDDEYVVLTIETIGMIDVFVEYIANRNGRSIFKKNYPIIRYKGITPKVIRFQGKFHLKAF